MSDDRSIAEIIGWQRCNCVHGCAWMYPPGSDPDADVDGAWVEAVAITPDDMLAWLTERCVPTYVGVKTPGDGPSGQYRVTVWPKVPIKADHYADSLHAALEAAVRAVAEVDQ